MLILLAFVGPKTPWGFLGIVPLTTGLLGSCPAYTLFGVSTCELSQLDRLHRRDRAALAEVDQRHRAGLTNAMRRISGDEALAEDAVQEGKWAREAWRDRALQMLTQPASPSDAVSSGIDRVGRGKKECRALGRGLGPA